MVVRVWPCFSSAAAAVHHARCTVQDFKHFLDTSGRELAQTHEFLVRARLAASSVTHLSSHTPHGHRCSGSMPCRTWGSHTCTRHSRWGRGVNRLFGFLVVRLTAPCADGRRLRHAVHGALQSLLLRVWCACVARPTADILRRVDARSAVEDDGVLGERHHVDVASEGVLHLPLHQHHQ